MQKIDDQLRSVMDGVPKEEIRYMHSEIGCVTIVKLALTKLESEGSWEEGLAITLNAASLFALF